MILKYEWAHFITNGPFITQWNRNELHFFRWHCQLQFPNAFLLLFFSFKFNWSGFPMAPQPEIVIGSCNYWCRRTPETWWRHQMETFSALLALCAGNSPVNGEFPSQRPVTQSFDIFFDLSLNKRFSKQSIGWWVEKPSRSLWRHCNEPMPQPKLNLCNEA